MYTIVLPYVISSQVEVLGELYEIRECKILAQSHRFLLLMM